MIQILKNCKNYQLKAHALFETLLTIIITGALMIGGLSTYKMIKNKLHKQNIMLHLPIILQDMQDMDWDNTDETHAIVEELKQQIGIKDIFTDQSKILINTMLSKFDATQICKTLSYTNIKVECVRKDNTVTQIILAPIATT